MTEDELKRIPHFEYVYSGTMLKYKKHLYKVDRHLSDDRPEECREVGGRCAFEGLKTDA